MKEICRTHDVVILEWEGKHWRFSLHPTYVYWASNAVEYYDIRIPDCQVVPASGFVGHSRTDMQGREEGTTIWEALRTRPVEVIMGLLL